MSDLALYRFPLIPATQKYQALAAAGVKNKEFAGLQNAAELLDNAEPPEEGIWRASDGRVLVICNTEMPKVSPQMIEWWFGWHLPSTERYRLWHPTAHIKADVMEDRSQLTDLTARYINNTSYVDEYVGRSLKKLAIRFLPPEQCGLAHFAIAGSTAICATTSDRQLRSKGGQLVHLIRPTAAGVQMRSAFWLGEIEHNSALLNSIIGPISNSKMVRQIVVSDTLAKDLLLHCTEEMNHLARFLPALYQAENAVARPLSLALRVEP